MLFAALGVGLATGRPALAVCTSGTAAAQFHAAVVEAHQAEVPLVVCTADQPRAAVAAPQTIDQARLFGGAVRAYVDLGAPDVALASRMAFARVRAIADVGLGPAGPPQPAVPRPAGRRYPASSRPGVPTAARGTARCPGPASSVRLTSARS